MAKLDRLGWAAGTSFVAHGVHVGIRASDAAVMPEIRRRLPAGARPSRRATVDHLVSIVAGGETPARNVRRLSLMYSGSMLAMRTRYFDEVLRFLEFHLEQFVAQQAPGRVFVHAGVVGWKGRGIVIPGASHSGKTTLVGALLAAGATYYSDEYAVFDAQGRVHPYLREMRVRTTSDEGDRVSAADLGARTGRRPLPVALVVDAPFAEGGRWSATPVSRGEGTLRLLRHTLSARQRPHDALSMLTAAVGQARVLVGRRGDAAEAAATMLRLAE